MNQNRNLNPSPQSKDDLPVHVVEQIIETQKQQLILKTEELKIREKELDINARLAEKQMSLQAEFLKQKPTESRKTFKIIAIFLIIFLIVVLAFFGYCVQTGNQDFALKIFSYIMYAVTTIAGYWAGKKTTKEQKGKSNDDIEDANIID